MVATRVLVLARVQVQVLAPVLELAPLVTEDAGGARRDSRVYDGSRRCGYVAEHRMTQQISPKAFQGPRTLYAFTITCFRNMWAFLQDR